ncbi:methyltransferase domain-containing protein [Nocardiopsis rhodophaea]|uniref:Protein-L-isoaspartate O-methyltransferase n=1 Tax=Nocardiopsis rhodophaea TaxID=280238 RepID=A0ABN2S6H3_9ACTN
MITADQRHAVLIDSLIQSGELVDERLIAAFRATPRHVFIPEVGALTAHGTVLDARTSPEAWLAAVYSDDAIITQVDDGDPTRQRNLPTSSSSAPTIVARMLEAADLRDGHRVLEIGTGTGWNAALLAARLGDANVTSVEVDPAVLAGARSALAAAGRSPATHLGDGAQGYPSGAPYDRTIATCSVTRVPRAWIDQTRAGGLIVTPWTAMEGAGVLAPLTVAEDGSASGRFRGGLGFMLLRSQRMPDAPPHGLDAEPDETRVVDTDVISPLTEFATAFPITFMVPSWRMGMRKMGTGMGLWLSATDGPSWARVYPYGDQWAVEQGGPRSLWDEVESATAEWIALGSPDHDRFGLTVTPDDRHRLWLDDPDGPGWDFVLPDR